MCVLPRPQYYSRRASKSTSMTMRHIACGLDIVIILCALLHLAVAQDPIAGVKPPRRKDHEPLDNVLMRLAAARAGALGSSSSDHTRGSWRRSSGEVPSISVPKCSSSRCLLNVQVSRRLTVRKKKGNGIFGPQTLAEDLRLLYSNGRY